MRRLVSRPDDAEPGRRPGSDDRRVRRRAPGPTRRAQRRTVLRSTSWRCCSSRCPACWWRTSRGSPNGTGADSTAGPARSSPPTHGRTSALAMRVRRAVRLLRVPDRTSASGPGRRRRVGLVTADVDPRWITGFVFDDRRRQRHHHRPARRVPGAVDRASGPAAPLIEGPVPRPPAVDKAAASDQPGAEPGPHRHRRGGAAEVRIPARQR